MSKQAEGTEGFYIGKDGKKDDKGFHGPDVFDHRPSREVQLLGIKAMRESGHYSEETIKGTYPEHYTPPKLKDRLAKVK